MLDQIGKNLLKMIAGMDDLPTGAFNIRANGESAARSSSKNINIVSKTDKPGIDIFIKAGTKGESVHIPVVLSKSGLTDTVYNDFYIGADSEVDIVAGCGINNCGCDDSQHDGVHRFFVGKNAKVKYYEKHYGEGEGRGKRLMNPQTEVYLEEGAEMEMETTQISGIDDTLRKTTAKQAANSSLVIHEKVMTTGVQNAVSEFSADLDGDGCSCNIISRTVAKDKSTQHFVSVINGNAACAGHTECDSIIMDQARVLASPQLLAACVDASLIHEAAIGKIAGDQLIKLMTLGLTEQEAEEKIVNGFLA